MDDQLTASDRDRRVAEIYDRVLEIEQRLIPTGLHVFGRPPDLNQLTPLLQMVASFDRYDGDEQKARALTLLPRRSVFLPMLSW